MKEKSLYIRLIPVMLVFFTMGFVDLVGIASNYVKLDLGLTDSEANIFPSLVFFWFLLSVHSAFDSCHCLHFLLNDPSYRYGKIFFMFFTLVASVMVALRRFLFLFWDFLVLSVFYFCVLFLNACILWTNSSGSNSSYNTFFMLFSFAILLICSFFVF